MTRGTTSVPGTVARSIFSRIVAWRSVKYITIDDAPTPVVSRHDGIASPVRFGAALSKGSGSGSLNLRATRTKLSLPSSPASRPLLRKWGNCAWRQTVALQCHWCNNQLLATSSSGRARRRAVPKLKDPIARGRYAVSPTALRSFRGRWSVPRFGSCPAGNGTKGMIHRVAHATKKRLGPRKSPAADFVAVDAADAAHENRSALVQISGKGQCGSHWRLFVLRPGDRCGTTSTAPSTAPSPARQEGRH